MLIASVYLAGVNTRRVKKALSSLSKGAVSKDMVNRAWRKAKGDWETWYNRSLVDEDRVRLILDGTVVKTQLDKKATTISVLVAIGVRHDGQKVALSIRNMGGENTIATTTNRYGKHSIYWLTSLVDPQLDLRSENHIPRV